MGKIDEKVNTKRIEKIMKRKYNSKGEKSEN